MGQPLKPGQRRGFDTHFRFNNPCHWTSPGISLFQPPRDPGSLHPGCMCLFSAHLFPSVGQHSWQVPEDALHPTGLKLPALGVPALARALLEHPAGRVPVTAAARCPHQTKKKKKPEDLPACKGAGASLKSQPVLLPCLAVLRGLLPWHPLGRASERWKAARGHGGEQRAVSIKGRTPLLVRVLLTASGSRFASQLLPLPFFRLLLLGPTASPSRRAGAPPQRSPGRLERRERGREQQHFQDEQECAPRRAALASSLILYS